MDSSPTKPTQQLVDLDFGEFCTDFEESDEFEGFASTQDNINTNLTPLQNGTNVWRKVDEVLPTTSFGSGNNDSSSLLDFSLPVTEKSVETSRSEVHSLARNLNRASNEFNLLDDDWSFDFLGSKSASVVSIGNLDELGHPFTQNNPLSGKISSKPFGTDPLSPQGVSSKGDVEKSTNIWLHPTSSTKQTERKEFSGWNQEEGDFGDFTTHRTSTEAHGFEEFFGNSHTNDNEKRAPFNLLSMDAEVGLSPFSKIKPSLISFGEDVLDLGGSTKTESEENSSHILDTSSNLVNWNNPVPHSSSLLIEGSLVKNAPPISLLTENVVNDVTESGFGSFASHTLNNKESFGSFFAEATVELRGKVTLSAKSIMTLSRTESIPMKAGEVLTFPESVDNTFTQVEEPPLFEPTLILKKWDTTVKEIFGTDESASSREELTFSNINVTGSEHEHEHEHEHSISFLSEFSEGNPDFQWIGSMNEEKHLASMSLKRKKRKARKLAIPPIQELIPVQSTDILVEPDSHHATPSTRQSAELQNPSLAVSPSDSKSTEDFGPEDEEKKQSSKFPIGQSILNIFNPSIKKEKSRQLTRMSFDVFDSSELFS